MDKQKLKKLLIGEFSIKRVIRSAVVIYLILMIFVWFFCERIMFPAPHTSAVSKKLA